MKSLNKKYIIFALITCSFIACKKSEGVPEDLEGMKKYVSQKKVELKQLQQEIDDLNKEILKMDPPKEKAAQQVKTVLLQPCLLYTSPSPRDRQKSRMPSSA